MDYPTRMAVESESDSNEPPYAVDLVANPIGVNHDGVMIFNGSCECKHFRCVLGPALKNPSNAGKVFRCKHIVWARANVLDYLLPVMRDSDPNLDEEYQP